jgi:hypothetical protein
MILTLFNSKPAMYLILTFILVLLAFRNNRHSIEAFCDVPFFRIYPQKESTLSEGGDNELLILEGIFQNIL